jgi:formiminotetrahydrofolate cyclodeaminase
MAARLTLDRPRLAHLADTARDVELSAVTLQSELIHLAEADALAYRAYLAARRLPRDSEREADVRRKQMSATARQALEVPLELLRAALRVLELAERLARGSNPNVVSDVGSAAHLAASAARSAILNVRINLPSLPDGDELRGNAGEEIERLARAVDEREATTARLVAEVLG